MKSIRMGLVGAVAATAIAGAAAAETLTIGVSLETPSIDPHFYAYKNSFQVAQQIFDLLIRQDAQQKYIPGLALEWNNLDDKTWEIKLRKGVKWHDGSPFTADDVLFNVERAKAGIPGSPTTPTRNFLLGGKEWKMIDDHTLQVVTEAPHATFAADFTEPVIGVQEERRGLRDQGLQRGHGGHRHRSLQVRRLHPGRQGHPRGQPRLLGRQARMGPGGDEGAAQRSRALGRALERHRGRDQRRPDRGHRDAAQERRDYGHHRALEPGDPVPVRPRPHDLSLGP